MDNLADIGLIGLAVMGPKPRPQYQRQRLSRGGLQPHDFEGDALSQQRSEGHGCHRHVLAGRICQEHQTTSQADSDDSGGRGRRQVNRAIGATAGRRRYHHRWRQLQFQRLDSPYPRSGSDGPIFHRRGRQRRRGRRALWSINHAWRFCRCLGIGQADLASGSGESAGRHALLRLGGRRWRRALCEDGA